MKIFSRLWWVFAIVGTIAAVLNPYIGAFGVYNFIELILLIILDINIICRECILKKHGGDKLFKKSLDKLTVFGFVLVILLFVIKVVLFSVVFFYVYNGSKLMETLILWNDSKRVGIIFSVIEFASSLIVVDSFVLRIKNARLLFK